MPKQIRSEAPARRCCSAAAPGMRGGLHKFNASEVAVDGGEATADDFLDAFGMS